MEFIIVNYTPTVAVDFDGVLHSYTSGWTGDIPTDPPEAGSLEFINKLIDEGYEVVIYTTRAETVEGLHATYRWLQINGFPNVELTSGKPKAIAYVDDRAVPYNRHRYGFDAVLDDIAHLKMKGPHHEEA
jgi:hypothetical protein